VTFKRRGEIRGSGGHSSLTHFSFEDWAVDLRVAPADRSRDVSAGHWHFSAREPLPGSNARRMAHRAPDAIIFVRAYITSIIGVVLFDLKMG